MNKSPDALQSGAKVSLRSKLAFGVGAVTDMMGFHGPVTLVNPIFNLELGLSPTLIGIAKGICRVWDALTDPAMGAISDRGLGRLGRRRPFIIAGSLAMALSFFALFNVPSGLSQGSLFAFMTVMLLVFYTAYTIFTVPYHALGYEMASNYDDRTRVMAWRLAFNMVGNAAVSWLFAATQLPLFGGTMKGAAYVAACAGLVMVAGGMITGCFVRERAAGGVTHTATVRTGIKAAIRNRPFLRLVGLAWLFLTAATVSGLFTDYLNFYHVYRGDLAAAAVVSSSGVTIGYAVTLCSAFGWTWLGRRFEKRSVLLLTLVLNAVFSASTWWLFTPEHPYWQVFYRILTQPLILGFWLMLQSMIADACEYEHYNGGSRRDAVLGAFVSFSQKVGVSLAFVVGGVVLDLSGFRAALGPSQPETAMLTLRVALVVFPLVTMAAAAWLAVGYRLDRREMSRIGEELRQRAAASGR